MDRAVVNAMLEDPAHQMWSDSDAQSRLGMVLDSDLGLCNAVKKNIVMIRRTLDEVLLKLKTAGLEEPVGAT